MLFDIVNLLDPATVDNQEVETLCSLLNYALISGRNTQSVPYCIDQMGQEEFLRALKVLIDNKLVYSTLKHNFAELVINIETIKSLGIDLEELVYDFKLQHYSLEYRDIKDHISVVKHRHGKNLPAFNRNNLNKAHNFEFKFDTEMLEKHIKEIASELVLKMLKQRVKQDPKFKLSESDYESIIIDVLKQYILSDGTYNLGGCNFDWRGRSIALQLEKILNPVGYKLGRALLVLPAVKYTTDDRDTLNSIYLFLAQELIGSCVGMSIAEKIEVGKQAYFNRVESDDLVTKIWTQRIFAQLDKLYEFGEVDWEVSIEVDFNNSLAMVTGLITGDKRLLNATNATGDIIADAWDIEGVRRPVAKLMTAKFYGSSASLKSLAKKKDLKVETKELRLLEREASSGMYAVIVNLGELLKEGSTIDTPTYSVSVLNQHYTVEVQKTMPVEVINKRYWTVVDGTLKMFNNHSVVEAKDYKRNRLSLYTGLIHNLDSWIMNRIIGSVSNALPVHDAVILLPHQASVVRKASTEAMKYIFDRKQQVLRDYMVSIGVINPDGTFKTPKGLKLYKKLIASIDPASSDTQFSPYALK
jgi:hypothetical protein